ncbi:12551_t:CDS:2 [Acaulospora morrowiae]|uniref:12551_t:CDS:1 n=1 Tax=Acaulospora morrowiae TaxID=94023 RepID=A0A9N9E0I2_9GLOM|nr:12551_t:CDS:2 [Acaulospora morrowiae]
MNNQDIYKLYHTNSQGETLYVDNQGWVFNIDDFKYPVLKGHLTDISLMNSMGALTLKSYQIETPNLISAQHACTFCGKAFQYPSTLKTHYNSHTGERPYACQFEGCGKSYTTSSNLLRHRKNHN